MADLREKVDVEFDTYSIFKEEIDVFISRRIVRKKEK